MCVTVVGGLGAALGCVMAEFVRFTLDDGSEVMFESAESDLVAQHGGPPDVREGGRLTERLQGVAEAAEQVAGSLRSRLAPDEVSLEFGLKVSGEVNWFFAKAQGEGTIKVTVKWAGNAAAAARPADETGPDPGRGDVRGPGRGGGGDRGGVRRRAAGRVGGAGRPPVPGHRRACAAAPGPRHRRQGAGGSGGAGVPGPGLGGQPGRATASRLDLGPASAGVDVAVLDLGEDRPGWLPAPVPVWPAARPPGRVQVFGYPLAEGPLNGVWRQFAVAGPAAAGTVQLDWIGDVGTFPGHSGGPVIDADGHALAGILVEGVRAGPVRPVRAGHADRPGVAAAAPALADDRGRSGRGAQPLHPAGPRAAQHRPRRGLVPRPAVALAAVRGWLTADEPPGQALVITGQPGAGKSAVLARAALSLEAGHGGPGLAFHARAATIGDFLTALADLTGMDTPASADELVTGLADLPAQPPIRVVLDALDEAASDHDRRQITEALAELAVLPGLRVAVATRPLAVGNPYAPGGLLAALGVTTRDDRNLVDLDSDTYFDLDGLRRFAAALLAQDGMDHPGPPGAAWTQYRARHAVRDRLAAVIAQRAGGNFLVAAMAAVPLSTEPGVIDPAARGFDPADIPSGVGEALSKYLDRLPGRRRERDRGLLTALAYARGAGLDDPAWLAFAAALGYSAMVADLDALRRSRAADYLLQTTPAERGARPVTRLFHQALADELLAARHQPSDESVLLDMLLGQAERAGWQDRYLREHVAEHAAAADRLDQLLEDPHYLLTVDPARLVPHLDTARSAPARAAAAVYRHSAHHLAPLDRPARASQLELTAHQLGCRSLAARIASAAPDRPWQTRWSQGRRAAGHQVLTGPPARCARGGGRGAAGRHPGHRQRRRRWPTARCGCGGWPTARRSGSRCAATPAGWRRWRSGRCRTAPRSSSAARAATPTARCGCGGWPTAPRSGSR